MTRSHTSIESGKAFLTLNVGPDYDESIAPVANSRAAGTNGWVAHFMVSVRARK